MSIVPICLGVTCIVTASVTVALQVSTARTHGRSWQELIHLLRPAHMPGVTVVALEAMSPHQTVVASTPEDRIAQIGGIKGIRGLMANANVLLALASHAERWNMDESRRVADLIRTQGLALRRAALLLVMASFFRFATAHQTRYVQRIALSYYYITESLLNLYKQVHAGHGQTLDHLIWLTPTDTRQQPHRA